MFVEKMKRKSQTCLFFTGILLLNNLCIASAASIPVELEKVHSRQTRQTFAKALNIDPVAVSEGIFKPDNIAIHVGQNLINFLSSSAAWAVFAAFTPYNTVDAGRSINAQQQGLYAYPSYENQEFAKRSLPQLTEGEIASLKRLEENHPGIFDQWNMLKKR